MGIALLWWCGTQGEYIAVEKVEATYKQTEAVEQVWVYGNSYKSCLVAVVVPKQEALLEWAKGQGKKGEAQVLLDASPRVLSTRF
jgi:long-chain acyl-CoA synthetase